MKSVAALQRSGFVAFPLLLGVLAQPSDAAANPPSVVRNPVSGALAFQSETFSVWLLRDGAQNGGVFGHFVYHDIADSYVWHGDYAPNVQNWADWEQPAYVYDFFSGSVPLHPLDTLLDLPFWAPSGQVNTRVNRQRVQFDHYLGGVSQVMNGYEEDALQCLADWSGIATEYLACGGIAGHATSDLWVEQRCGDPGEPVCLESMDAWHDDIFGRGGCHDGALPDGSMARCTHDDTPQIVKQYEYPRRADNYETDWAENAAGLAFNTPRRLMAASSTTSDGDPLAGIWVARYDCNSAAGTFGNIEDAPGHNFISNLQIDNLAGANHCDHVGDIDISDDGQYLFVPRDNCTVGFSNINEPPEIAVFSIGATTCDANSEVELSFSHRIELDQHSYAPWVAYNPQDDLIYVPPANHTNDVNKYNRFSGAFEGTVELVVEGGGTMYRHQGGDFEADTGRLYVVHEYMNFWEDCSKAGIRVFQMTQNRAGQVNYDYEWSDHCGSGLNDHELEGIDVTDLDGEWTFHDHLHHQVHLMVLNNDAFSQDNAWVVHFSLE